MSETLKLDGSGLLRVRLEHLNTEAEDEVFAQFLSHINARNPRTLGPDPHPSGVEPPGWNPIRFELTRRS